MNETLFLHALSTIPGVGAVTLRALLSHFGNAKEAWEADPREWSGIPGIGPKACTAFMAHRETFSMDMAKQLLEKEEIYIVSFLDPNFPSLLQEIPSPPAILYARGNPNAWLSKPLLAIVGSRKFTPYGKQVATELSRELSQAGFSIVSGLAFGIDALAHEATLDAGGLTVAVLGSGCDSASISPQSHARLAETILEKEGALLSEFAPGTLANTGTFPARNRIMAGMTLGTVVVEAAEESGSLITARLALDFNREVFSVPGSIFSPYSSGSNALLKQGAKVVTGVSDILEELAFALPEKGEGAPESPQLLNMNEEEKKIFLTLTREPLHIDKIIEVSTLETTRVSSIITKLEMCGLVKNIGNLHYIRVQ